MDCFFLHKEEGFRYRAGAIIIEDGCVLMIKNDKDSYLYSVGGAVHIGETAEDAVQREVLEETGEHYDVERLLFIHENFFYEKVRHCHELSLYFLMKQKGTKNLKGASSCGMNGAKENCIWIPLNEYRNYKAYPQFFVEKLFFLPPYPEHIITKDY